MDKRMGKKKVIIIIGCMVFAFLCGCDTLKSNDNHTTTETSQNAADVEKNKERKATTDAAGEAKSEQDTNANGNAFTEHTKKAEPAERQSNTDTAREYVTTDENGETIILQPQSLTNLPENKEEETVNAEKNVDIEKSEESEKENAQKQEPEQSEKTEEIGKVNQEPSNTDGEKKSEELELPFVPRGE